MDVFGQFLFVFFISLTLAAIVYLIFMRRALNVRWPAVWADRAVFGFAAVYALTFSALAILRYQTFHTDGYDLAIFDQVVWNSLHGRLFENTILADAPLLIGQRFSPILLAFVPLYALWSSPIILLVAQTVGIAAGVFPLYWFTRARIGPAAGALIAIAYFLFPATEFVNLAEFHEIALAIPLFAYATFFLLRQKYVPLSVLLGVALLVKEEIGLFVIVFGGFIFLIQRQRWMGLTLMLLGAVWFVALLQIVLPELATGAFGSGYYYFGKGIAAGTGRYDYLGNSLSEIGMTIATRPDLVLNHLLVQRKIEFVLYLFAPLAFLPIFCPELMLLTLPTFATSLLSDYALQTSIEHHYSAALVPLLFFASVIALQRLGRWRNPGQASARMYALGALVLAASVGNYYFHAPGPFTEQFDPKSFAFDAHSAQGHVLLSEIPDEAQAVVQSAFLPQLSRRERIYGFPSDGIFCATDYLFADTTQPQYAMFADAWNAWLGSGYFEIVSRQDGFVLARRKPPESVGQGKFVGRASALVVNGMSGWQWTCLNIEWRSEETAANSRVRAWIEDDQGHEWAASALSHRAGQLGDQLTLPLAPTTPTGTYRVWLSVNDSDAAPIATVRVNKDTRSYTASQLQIEHPYFVDMREMRLLGFAPLPAQIAPGESLPVGVYWRARSKPQGDYVVKVQLRDPFGAIAFEQTARPAGNTYPTTQWSVGEVLLDWHDLNLPANLATGNYDIFVGMIDAANGDVLGESRIAPIAVK